MRPRVTRFSDKTTNEIEAAVQQRGFASSSAFIRYAVEQELSGRQDGLTGAEERLAASIEQVRRDLLRSMRTQQAVFAYLDTLTKTLLTCIPEPPADARTEAVTIARVRHARLLRSAGNAMVGDSRLAMQELTDNVGG